MWADRLLRLGLCRIMGKTTRMTSLLPLAIVLAIASAYGVWYQRSRGKVNTRHVAPSSPHLTAEVIGKPLGSRVTLVQFSSAFCTPCRATKVLLQEITAPMDDVVHVDIDAESHLDLVRQLDIRSTPTTLILDRDGVEVGRAVGAAKRDQVLAALESVR